MRVVKLTSCKAGQWSQVGTREIYISDIVEQSTQLDRR
jgi:hypothetical protein